MYRLLGISLLLSLSMTARVDARSFGLPDFTELVEENHPVVVNISTTRARGGGAELPPGIEWPDIEGTPFGELFRKFFEDQERGGDERRESPSSLGSGFIISADGYVLTNNHVVDGAEQVFVRLHDRRQLPAEVVGTDERSDVAVLKVEAEDLPVAKIGASDTLSVGEWVLAIGSPFGFDHSVTAGIVSAKGRSLPRENYTPFIQTDVAINPGNSGGPLFDLDGRVVGVNSQIYSRSGGFMGLSFAIPIEVAMDVAEQLRENGRVSRGWLGVVIQEVTGELAESFGMERATGALVSQIVEGSPASRSDIQVGDVIVEFNGDQVPTSSSLPPLVGLVRAGTDADVVVLRRGEREVLRVTIGELPGQEELANATQGRGVEPKPAASSRLGVVVDSPDETQRDAAGVPEGGVIVTEVRQGGLADEAGVLPGDMILMLGSDRVDSVADFERLAEQLPAGSAVAVLVHRGSNPLFLPLRLPE